jgi:transcription termination factor Rho
MQTQTGILEVIDRKDGRLRVLDNTLITGPNDPIVSAKLIDKYQLRAGQTLEVQVNPAQPNNNGNGHDDQGGHHSRRNRRGKNRGRSGGGGGGNRQGSNAPRVQEVLTVDGRPPDASNVRPRMEDLTSIDPKPRMTLEYPGCPPACRLIDMFCPIGYGTRGMIVSPPKAGKTTLLQNIAVAIEKNHPDVEVFALLIDERPEEVTDFRRNVPCQVLASSNDHPPERHVGLAVVAIERAKRMAEQGKHVVVLLDSLTRVGRAFNTAPGRQQVGRTLSGGVDAGALAVPKQLFGAARNIEEGGSLTIIATALVDTGSRGDQVIFEEFKGTGNMELILDRKIAEQRIFPAIDLAASGTRKEHLLLSENELTTINALRRRLLNMPPPQQIEQLLKALERFKTNADLVGSPQSPARA